MTNLPLRLRGTLADPAVLAARTALCGLPKVQPLDAVVDALRTRYGAVPNVDPADGGTAARLLLLLETPGPGMAPLRFVSRDNPTGTAANLRRFFETAGLARDETVIWNVVPWIIHAEGARNRTPRAGEVAAGLAELPAFLARLPALAVVVLAGRVAGRARLVIEAFRPGLPMLDMPHPSPTIVCTSPMIPARIVETLTRAAQILETSRSAQQVGTVR